MKQVNCSKQLMCAAIIFMLGIGIFSCKSTDNTNVSVAYFKVGQPVKSGVGNPVSGSIKGYMKSDSSYYITGDTYINALDTLLLQPGAKIYFKGNYNLVVKGTLLSLGIKAKQNYISIEGVKKTDTQGAPAGPDPAYGQVSSGITPWGGILCDTSCKSLVLKWTHVEYGGNTIATTPISGVKNGQTAWMITFDSPKGIFILEDSWVYGGVDDPIRVQGGKINIMRNTFEKSGFQGGECINIKGNTVGNVAYNLFIGSGTNGPKASNKGVTATQTNIYMYNNTMVNCGFRRNESGRGGSMNFEEGAKGNAYNNIMVNCKYGLRIVGATKNYNGNALVVADTASLRNHYGYNLNYTDSVTVANQIYPVGFYTFPQATDFPLPTSYLPANYQVGQVYDGTKAVQASGTNPQFVNFPLPQSGGTLSSISYATGFDFHLKPSSPALGKGYTSFSPLSVVPVSDNFGASTTYGITLPNKDLGAYPSDGTGNQH